MTTAPAFSFSVFRILGISDHIQKSLVARDASDILGRAGARSINASRLVGRAFKKKIIFNFNSMIPVVAKIV